MKLDAHGSHLTYCTNVHAGESLADVRQHLSQHVARVKEKVAPDRDFGVGLRLSAQAAQELKVDGALAEFKDLLASLGLYVFTLNGFPYGRFHGARVKARVYRPDWQEDERLEYTNLLAELLAELLPADAELAGSISTVPVCDRARGNEPRAREKRRERLLLHALELARLRESTGRLIQLGLEPEPTCLLETTEEAVAFIEQELLSESALHFVAAQTGGTRARSEALIRDHIGVCFDACHAAVEFEDAKQSLGLLKKAGIAIVKLQLSSGLVLSAPGKAQLEALRGFDDGVYLHQVVMKRGHELVRFRDLADAFAASTAAAEEQPQLPQQQSQPQPQTEWRVHFHVPIFLRDLGSFSSTQDFLASVLELYKAEPFTQHLEVETYTWGVLPEAHRQASLEEDLVRELEWARAKLSP